MMEYADGNSVFNSTHYHAWYVKPKWAVVDVEKCLLKPLGRFGAHLHYADVPVADRPACLEDRKIAAAKAAQLQAANSKAPTKKVVLPQAGPVPATRPAKADVKSVILAAR